jgi:hypothetical protein
LIAAAAMMTVSYVFGEWYASRIETAQQEVWSAYLNGEIRSQTAELEGRLAVPPVLVIQNRTQQAYRHWLLTLVWPVIALSNQRPRSRLPSLQTGTFCRYLLGSLRSHPVRRLTLSGPYRLADPAAVAAYGQKGPRWEALFPQSMGYTVLSAVGFNADQTQALLQADHFCGLCGHGGYILLRKVNGRWVIEAEAGSWIS